MTTKGASKMTATKFDVYGASDYAGMSGGKWSFYYGYEFLWCPIRGFVKGHYDCPDEDDHEWSFEASYDGRVVAQYKSSDIDASMGIDTEVNVLRGISRMLAENDIAPAAALVDAEGDGQ